MTDEQELNDMILARMEVNAVTGGHSALAALVNLNRAHLSALSAGDRDSAEYHLSRIRTAVSEDRLESALRDVGRSIAPDPSWKAQTWSRLRKARDLHWWEPLSMRMRVAVLGLVALCLAALIAAGAMRLQVTDTEAQLHQCTSK